MDNLAVCGSLADLAEKQDTRIANVFMNIDHVIIVDVSGSMSAHDAYGGEKTRYDAACVELRKLQSKYQGKFAVFGFSDETEFFPGGIPRLIGAGTNLTGALEYVADLDGTDVTFDIISDGYPDDAQGAMFIASRFTTKINTIYVGPTNAIDAINFMQQLASSSGGKSAVNDASGIGTTITGLLTA